MHIACVGGGPAALVFAISMKLRDPRHDIVVFERNDPGDTFGWGVVFSDQTMENLRANDPKSADEIEAGFAHWDDIDVHIHGETITSSGHGFAVIVGAAKTPCDKKFPPSLWGLFVLPAFGGKLCPVPPAWGGFFSSFFGAFVVR